MNEAQTRHDLIDPALHEAGWNTLPARIATEQGKSGALQKVRTDPLQS